jgi:hypothetical protein
MRSAIDAGDYKKAKYHFMEANKAMDEMFANT